MSPFWTGFSLVMGLFFIWFSGYWAGRLWERGTQVRKVMRGEDPPPWDDTPLIVPAEWCAPGCDGPHIETRSDVYDRERDGYV